MASELGGKPRWSDIEVLVGDKLLWRELQTSLSSSNAITSMAINELTHSFIDENRAFLEQRRAAMSTHYLNDEASHSPEQMKMKSKGDPRDSQKSSAPTRLLLSHHRLANVFKRSSLSPPPHKSVTSFGLRAGSSSDENTSTKGKRAFSLGITSDLPLPSFASTMSDSSIDSEDDCSVGEDMLPIRNTEISITNLGEVFDDMKSPRKWSSNGVKTGRIKELGMAISLSDKLRRNPGFAKALDNLTVSVESHCGTTLTSSDDSVSLTMQEHPELCSNDDDSLLVDFPERPRSPTQTYSYFTPPVATTA